MFNAVKGCNIEVKKITNDDKNQQIVSLCYIEIKIKALESSKGIVIKSTGSWYQVDTEEIGIWSCRIVGKFRIGDIKLTNPVAVGDEVLFRKENDHERTGVIHEILPRKNYVIRQSPRKKHDLHLLASNIDQAMVVVTVVSPNLKQGFIDRFLMMTEPYDIPTIIVFNKADLYDEGAMNTFQYLEEIYTKIGYTTRLISAQRLKDIADIKELLVGKTTLISGQSGVGKSTIVNSLEPELLLKTQELSDFSGKGQHTTTFAERHPLKEGGYIIDTPGIKSLSFSHFEVADVAHNFREIFERSEDCKFRANCLHRNEPGCAVKDSVEAGEISPLRYGNYLTLLEEVEDQNYWERHKDY